MSIQWGQIRPSRRLSWHIFLSFTRMPGMARSICKRNLDAGTVRDDRPGRERTCEDCLRKHVRAEETAEDTTFGNQVAPI